jgi:hypothetical protein
MHLLLATALLLAAAPDAGSPSAAPEIHVAEGLPAGFQADGKLDEWKGPPTLTLGPANQVAGSFKVASPEDLSAKVWLAVGPEGLAIAGEVRDDHVLPSTKPTELNADHVEVWLALPAPPMPVLGFSNQFGEQAVATPEDCDKKEGQETGGTEDPEACRKWWKEQAPRHKKLAQSFVAQYALSAAGAVRFGSDVAMGPVHFEPMPGGYRFEALVPVAAFPRTSEAPLAHLRVLVDIVDNDEGRAKQESFLSSSPARRFGDPATFHAVTLATPLRYCAWPELLERALSDAAADGAAASYQPGPNVNAFQVWLNPEEAYQYTPQRSSPEVDEVNLGEVKVLAKRGDIELITVPAGVSMQGGAVPWLVTRRGRELLDVQRVGRSEVRAAKRGDSLYVLSVYAGSYQEDGHGMCGACEIVTLSLSQVGPDGKFSEPLFNDEAGGPPNGALDPHWKASKDLSQVEVYGDYEVAGGKTKHFFSRHTYNPKTGKYEQATQGSSTGEEE